MYNGNFAHNASGVLPSRPQLTAVLPALIVGPTAPMKPAKLTGAPVPPLLARSIE